MGQTEQQAEGDDSDTLEPVWFRAQSPCCHFGRFGLEDFQCKLLATALGLSSHTRSVPRCCHDFIAARDALVSGALPLSLSEPKWAVVGRPLGVSSHPVTPSLCIRRQRIDSSPIASAIVPPSPLASPVQQRIDPCCLAPSHTGRPGSPNFPHRRLAHLRVQH